MLENTLSASLQIDCIAICSEFRDLCQNIYFSIWPLLEINQSTVYVRFAAGSDMLTGPVSFSSYALTRLPEAIYLRKCRCAIYLHEGRDFEAYFGLLMNV